MLRNSLDPDSGVFWIRIKIFGRTETLVKRGSWLTLSGSETGAAHLLPPAILPALAALTPPLQADVLHQVLAKDGAACLLDVEEDHDVLAHHVEEDRAGAAVVVVVGHHLGVGHHALLLSPTVRGWAMTGSEQRIHILTTEEEEKLIFINI